MLKAEKQKRRFTKQEWSWIMYDWANSVYATNIMAAIFPTIFVSVAGAAGDQWWGYATSVATFLVAVLAPLLGAVADYQGMKKKFFSVFAGIGIVFTALIAATNDWRVMLVGYVISRIGFSGSNLFYDSFLTDVTTNERMDRVSSWGYAMGYIGGSTIPFVISIVMLMTLGYGNPIAQKFSVLITSVWWLVFTIPFLKNVQQTHYIQRSPDHSPKQTFRNIGRTAKEIFQRKGLFLFVVAYFFYIDGVRHGAWARRGGDDSGAAGYADCRRPVLYSLFQAGYQNLHAQGAHQRDCRVYLHLRRRLLYGLLA